MEVFIDLSPFPEGLSSKSECLGYEALEMILHAANLKRSVADQSRKSTVNDFREPCKWCNAACLSGPLLHTTRQRCQSTIYLLYNNFTLLWQQVCININKFYVTQRHILDLMKLQIYSFRDERLFCTKCLWVLMFELICFTRANLFILSKLSVKGENLGEILHCYWNAVIFFLWSWTWSDFYFWPLHTKEFVHSWFLQILPVDVHNTPLTLILSHWRFGKLLFQLYHWASWTSSQLSLYLKLFVHSTTLELLQYSTVFSSLCNLVLCGMKTLSNTNDLTPN